MTDRLSRQALWPSAQAIQLLPTPVGPMISKFWRRSIHSPATSFWNNALSRPRGAFVSMSSTTAFCRNFAKRKRFTSRLFSRSVALAIDQQSESLLECECCDGGLSLLFVECLRHAGQTQRDEAVQ